MSISIDGSGSITGIDQGLNVSGVLTFDDVTNVDSVGLVTARSGLHVTSGNTGIGTNNPGSLLHALGSYGTVRVENDNTAQYASSGIELKGPAGDERSTKIIHGNSNAGGTETYFQIEQYNAAGSYVKTLSTYSYQYDYWAFKTGASGTEKLRITSNGNVGIGTDNPDTKLHLEGSQNTLLHVESTDAFAGITMSDTTGSVIMQTASGYLRFLTGGDAGTLGSNSTEKVRITSDGKVGIGTDNPRATYLHVGDNNGVLAGSVFTSSPLSVFASDNLGGTTGDDHKIAIFGGRSTGNTSGLSIYHYRRSTGTSWTTDGFSLRQEVDNTSNIYEYMNFAGGNIGINSTSPTEKLDVDGNIKLSGRLQENMPADFWSQDNSFYCISDGANKLGNISHQGSYRVHITSNGYRNATSSQWTSYGVNSFTGASSIGLDPQGVIIFGTQASKSNGSAANVDERVRIDDDRMTFAQNRRLRFAPNSGWGAGLNLGGNGHSSDTTYGSMAITNGNIHIDPRGGAYGTYLCWYNGGNGTFFGNGAGAQRGRIDGAGNLTLSGSYPGSDLRLKENIETITGATDTIKALMGKTFTWKPEAGLDSYKRYGFIAQEVQQVVPDLVKDIGCHYFDADDNLIDSIDPTESDEDREAAGLTRSLTVNNEGVTPILVEAMKELIAKVETLETRISTLEDN